MSQRKLDFQESRDSQGRPGCGLDGPQGPPGPPPKQKIDYSLLNQEELKTVLYSQRKLNIEFIEAARKGDLDFLHRLLQAGADIHAYDDSALRRAAQYGHTEIVKMLLQAGANVHADEESPLRWAAENGHFEVVQVLLQAGAKVRADRGTLGWPVHHGHIETVKVLLQVGANVQDTESFVLRVAARGGHTEIVQMLLQAGADIHAKNGESLALATKYGHVETVQLLLSPPSSCGLTRGADSSKVTFQVLKKFLTPKFILSLPENILAGMETSHKEMSEKYGFLDKRNLLRLNADKNAFIAKISLADLYYRPGEMGYYQAISF